jgi:hypothetical protein
VRGHRQGRRVEQMAVTCGLALLCACDMAASGTSASTPPTSASPTQETHPQARYRVWPKAPDHELRLDRRNLRGQLEALAHRIEGRELLHRLPDPVSDLRFLSLDQAAFDDSGNVYILDSRTPQVVVLDPAGRMLSQILPQSGDEQLSHPLALAVTAPGEMLIASLSRQIDRWKLDARKEWHRTSEFGEMPSMPVGFCQVGGEVFAHATPFKDSTIIYPVGNDRPPFGVVYRATSDRINLTARQGKVACVAKRGGPAILWAAEAVLNELRAYDPAGNLIWLDVLSDAVPPEFVQTTGGSKTGIPETGFHRVHALVSTNDVVVLQLAVIGRNTFELKKPYEGLYTFLIDPRTGDGSLASTTLPTMLALSSDHIVLSSNEPTPVVSIYRY